MDQKTYFSLIIYSHCSTNLENLAKIDPADFEIAGLTRTVKNKYKTRNSSRTYGPPYPLSAAERAKNITDLTKVN